MRVSLALALGLASFGLLRAQEPPAAGTATGRVDFEKQIAPILLRHCIECHGPKLQKGDLRLDARAHLFPVGDEEAWVVAPGKADDSELVRRIGLPAGDDDVMPNKGELLTKAQQELVRRWVAEGADWPATADAHIAKELAAAVLPKITFDLPEVDAAAQVAIDEAIARLEQAGAVVQQVAADTKAVDVNFSLLRDKVGDKELALLPPLAPVLVWLNLSRTAITDAGAEQLASLVQLRRLHVANTNLGDKGFAAMASLQRLEYLNAYGTGLTDAGLASVVALPKLKHLYVWESKVTAAGVASVREQHDAVEIDLGDYVAERMAAAEKEIAEREARNKPVNDMCPVKTDQPVDPAQTAEHEGRKIGFCCAKCRAAFLKDPAKYADKIVPRAETPKLEPAKPDTPKQEPAK